MAPKKEPAGQRDECVAYAMECLWANLEQHLKDKFIFPQIVSHAVARTLAGMVHMVSVGMLERLESWDAYVDGRVAEEWNVPQEPVLPPVDSWARGIVPVKRLPSTPAAESPTPVPSEATTVATVATESCKPVRRATITGAAQQHHGHHQHATPEVYDRKGSPLRRFSEGYVLPPELIQKLKPPDGSVDGSLASSRKESLKQRKSTKVEPRKSTATNTTKRASRAASLAAPFAAPDTARKSSVRRSTTTSK